MSYLIASLPPLKCFVRREFLYNFEKGHGELDDWFYTIESRDGV
jgi:hypothetical protein